MGVPPVHLRFEPLKRERTGGTLMPRNTCWPRVAFDDMM
jgi:hypothetical protein